MTELHLSNIATTPSTLDVVVPLFRSAKHIPKLFERVNELTGAISLRVRLVLVLDGPDVETEAAIESHVKDVTCRVRVVNLSRNFGVASALAAGMSDTDADMSICMGSDLQEPSSFFVSAVADIASGDFDIVLGARRTRDDPFLHRIGASIYWFTVRQSLGKEIPRGGFDVFAINSLARDALVALPEINANITTQLFWIGFRRKFSYFDRVARSHGRSSWTFRRKLYLFVNSLFGLGNQLAVLASLTIFASLLLSIVNLVVWSARAGFMQVQPTSDSIGFLLLFANFVSLNFSIAFGLLWSYKSAQNSRNQPRFIVSSRKDLEIGNKK